MLDVGFGDGFFRFTPSSGPNLPLPSTARYDRKRKFGQIAFDPKPSLQCLQVMVSR